MAISMVRPFLVRVSRAAIRTLITKADKDGYERAPKPAPRVFRIWFGHLAVVS